MPELPNLLLYHGWIVVPEAPKTDVMRNLHMQHISKLKTLANAGQLYFWVGISQDIKLMVAACQVKYEPKKMRLAQKLAVSKKSTISPLLL